MGDHCVVNILEIAYIKLMLYCQQLGVHFHARDLPHISLIENELPMSRLSKVIVFQTHRYMYATEIIIRRRLAGGRSASPRMSPVTESRNACPPAVVTEMRTQDRHRDREHFAVLLSHANKNPQAIGTSSRFYNVAQLNADPVNLATDRRTSITDE